MDGQRVVAGSRGIVRVICGGDIFSFCLALIFGLLHCLFVLIGLVKVAMVMDGLVFHIANGL